MSDPPRQDDRTPSILAVEELGHDCDYCGGYGPGVELYEHLLTDRGSETPLARTGGLYPITICAACMPRFILELSVALDDLNNKNYIDTPWRR